MNPKYIRNIGRIAAALLIVALSGCSEEMEPEKVTPEPEPVKAETCEIPVRISLTGDWGIEINAEDGLTRAVPPGIGGNNEPNTENPIADPAEFEDIDEVRLLTFRRKDSDDAITAEDDGTATNADNAFIYDPTNDKKLVIKTLEAGVEDDELADIKDSQGLHLHKFAEGSITKVYGYEYRVIAIAYSTTRGSQFANQIQNNNVALPLTGDNNRFLISIDANTTADNIMATVCNATISNSSNSWREFFNGSSSSLTAENTGCIGTSAAIAEVPQIFYGECYQKDFGGNRSTVIKYAVADREGDLHPDQPIYGVLYRGMAKVEVNITLTAFKPTAKNYSRHDWVALMSDNLLTQVGLSGYDDFKRAPGYAADPTDKGYAPAAYMQDIDFKTGDASKTIQLTAYFIPCKTHLALRLKSYTANRDIFGTITLPGYEIRNGKLEQDKTNVSQGNGTGIISPDLINDVFYLRRNHYYKLNVKDSEVLMTQHALK